MLYIVRVNNVLYNSLWVKFCPNSILGKVGKFSRKIIFAINFYFFFYGFCIGHTLYTILEFLFVSKTTTDMSWHNFFVINKFEIPLTNGEFSHYILFFGSFLPCTTFTTEGLFG